VLEIGKAKDLSAPYVYRMIRRLIAQIEQVVQEIMWRGDLKK
jgi:hypothetical protein